MAGFGVFSLLFVLTNIESTLQRNAARGWWAAGASHKREIKTIPRRTKQEKQTFLWYLDVILLYAVYRAVTGLGRHGRGKLNEKLLWRWEHAGCLLGRRFLSGKSIHHFHVCVPQLTLAMRETLVMMTRRIDEVWLGGGWSNQMWTVKLEGEEEKYHQCTEGYDDTLSIFTSDAFWVIFEEYTWSIHRYYF